MRGRSYGAPDHVIAFFAVPYPGSSACVASVEVFWRGSCSRPADGNVYREAVEAVLVGAVTKDVSPFGALCLLFHHRFESGRDLFEEAWVYRIAQDVAWVDDVSAAPEFRGESSCRASGREHVAVGKVNVMGSCAECVSGEERAGLCVKEADAVRSVSWRVNDLQRTGASVQDVAVSQQPARDGGNRLPCLRIEARRKRAGEHLEVQQVEEGIIQLAVDLEVVQHPRGVVHVHGQPLCRDLF